MFLRGKYLIGGITLIGLLGIFWVSSANIGSDSWRAAKKNYKPILVADTGGVELPLPHGEDPLNPVENTGGISLDWPENINYDVQYDPITGQYVIGQTIGDSMVFRPYTSYGLDEYLDNSIRTNIS
ncbi:MAG: hypothetical protein ACJAU0_002428, partial [Flavobacteriales bacterium]